LFYCFNGYDFRPLIFNIWWRFILIYLVSLYIQYSTYLQRNLISFYTKHTSC